MFAGFREGFFSVLVCFFVLALEGWIGFQEGFCGLAVVTGLCLGSGEYIDRAAAIRFQGVERLT